jgi:signal transduction histidine kinase
MERIDVGSHRFLPLSSLRWRLPLLILALLLSIGSTYAWMAYRGMNATLRAEGTSRLHDAGAELAFIFAQAAGARLVESQRVADDPAIRTFMSSGEAPDAAVEVLKKFAGRPTATAALRVHAPGRPIRIERGNVLLERSPDALSAHAVPARDVVSELHVRDGRVFFGTESRLPPSHGDGPGGVLTSERGLTESAGITLIQRLVGNDAHIRLGNAKGDVWTDLSRPTEGPPRAAHPGETVSYLDEHGRPRLGIATPVKGTPWAVWVDFSDATLLAPARALLWNMLLPTLIVTIIGALAVAVASKRITDPLEAVANAADAIAAGSETPQLHLARKDEIGRLANAFNEMAARVRNARESLEARVEDRTRELTAVNRELEAFSYSVSHDLRAPLRSIDGFSQAILEDCSDQLGTDGQEHLARIRRAAQRMGQLIDDLLNLSRVARAEMRRQDVNLSAMASKILDGLAAADTSRNIDCRVQPDIRSTGDPRLLEVALTNLLDNAWKFTRNRVDTVIEFGARQNGHGLVYFVRDNGAGFDMAYSNKLFGAFQRLHQSADFPGTGIGLATVQRIVNRHGGRIWAEGQPDRYAAFYFTLNSETA